MRHLGAGAAADFTEATRGEPGCPWFDWSRSPADPAEYVLVQTFRDGDADAAHVNSEHFKKAQQSPPPHFVQTPRIVNFTVPQDDWSLLGDLAVQETIDRLRLTWQGATPGPAKFSHPTGTTAPDLGEHRVDARLAAP